MGSRSCCPAQVDPDASDAVRIPVTAGMTKKQSTALSKHQYLDISLEPENESKLSRITDICKTRQDLLEELVTKEEAHIELLKHISDNFVQPLSKICDVPKPFERQFDILDDLCRDHDEFLRGYREADNIPLHIVDNFDFVKNYSKFINEYAHTSATIIRYKEDPELSKIVETSMLDMSLIKVLARPFEYRTWIDRVVSKTQHKHWQRQDLGLAQQKVQFVHDHLLEANKEKDRVQKLLEMSKKIKGYDVSYSKRRRLLLEVDCKYCKNATFQKAFSNGKAVIFSDIGLICDKTYTMQSLIEDFKAFERVEVGSQKFGLRLLPEENSVSEPLDFFAPDESTRSEWESRMQDLRLRKVPL